MSSRQPETEVPSKEQVNSVLKPESAAPKSAVVGGKTISIEPLKRRWQSMFFASAWPMVEAQLAAPESIVKSFIDETFLCTNSTSALVKSELDADKHLDRAAAVILASKIVGAEKNAEGTVSEQVEWLRDNSTTEELRALVDAQVEIERLADRVGNLLPQKFEQLLSLAGLKGMKANSLKQLLSSLQSKLQESSGTGS